MKQRKTILILTLILVTAFLLIGCFVNKDSSSKTTNGNVKETKETVEQPETEPKTELTEPIHPAKRTKRCFSILIIYPIFN